MAERNKLLRKLQAAKFAAWELHLYLDTHPCDKEAFEKLLYFEKKADEARLNYTQEFGPLYVSNSNSKQGYQWVCGPWPWQRQ